MGIREDRLAVETIHDIMPEMQTINRRRALQCAIDALLARAYLEEAAELKAETEAIRRKAAERMAALPMMVVVGERALVQDVRRALGMPGSWMGWTRYVRCARRDDDFHTLRGLRGPNVWWVDWGATNEQKIFCRAHGFTLKTMEECHAAIDAYLAAS
jgi:hypothetical protein